MNDRDPVIVSAVRTPIGSFGGVLRDILHVKLAATVMEEVCKRVKYQKEELDDIYWGVVMVRSDENGLAAHRWRLSVLHQWQFAWVRQMQSSLEAGRA